MNRILKNVLSDCFISKARKHIRNDNFVVILFLINMCLSGTLWSIELSLEENRGESGTVGYVDIERIFREYSGTLSARDNFQKEIKDREGLINIRKSEIFSLKAEIAKLRQEREFALRLPLLIKQREEIDKIALSVVSVSSSAVDSSTDAVQSLAVPGSTDTVSQVAPSGKPDPSPVAPHVVGETNTPISTSPVASASGGREVNRSTKTASVIDMPGISNVPLDFFKFEVSTSVPEIDMAISKKEEALRTKETELKDFQRRIELELLKYESNETEMILGKIYIALRELAVREGVSVVVDKRNILFGHSAVDLTDKLLEKLENSGI